jgi:hypothetical protein
MAMLMNADYFGYGPEDNASSGNVIWFPENIGFPFKDQIKCSVVNPPNDCVPPAQAECYMNAAIFNHEVSVSVDGKKRIFSPTYQKQVGFVINSSLVDRSVGRCFYLWDSSPSGLMNRGCGEGAKWTKCEKDESAYHNVCASGKTCRVGDEFVKRAFCDGYGGDREIPATNTDAHCFIPGPAVDWVKGSNLDDSKSGNLKKMVDERVKRSTPKLVNQTTNVIIDEELLWGKMLSDPALAVVAVVHEIGVEHPDIFLKEAQAARDSFCSKFAQPAKCIPLVGFDITVDVSQKGAEVYKETLELDQMIV